MSQAAYIEHAAGEDPEARLEAFCQSPQEMARLAGVIAAIPADARRVLDVGCGGGVALRLLREARPEVVGVGVDLSRRAVEAGRRRYGLDLIVGGADALPFADRAFDAVLATELLEHLPHDRFRPALAEIERVAARAVIVTVPYRERRVQVICPACGCRFHPFYHVRSFGRTDLQGLLAGFDCVSIDLIWTRGFFPGVHAARRLKAALGHPAPLPHHTVCPQCSYRRPRAGGEAGEGGAAESGAARGVRAVVQAVMTRVPRPARPRWARAVYRRR